VKDLVSHYDMMSGSSIVLRKKFKNRPEKQVSSICSGTNIARSRTSDRPRLVQAKICSFLYVDVCSRALDP
jgi:hypothetical protein